MSQPGGPDDPNKRRPSISGALADGIKAGGKLKKPTTADSEGNKGQRVSPTFGGKTGDALLEAARAKAAERRGQVHDSDDESVKGWSEEEEAPKAKSPVTPRAASPVQQRAASPVQQRAASPVQQRAASPVQQRAASPVQQRAASPVQQRTPSPTKGAPQTPPRPPVVEKPKVTSAVPTVPKRPPILPTAPSSVTVGRGREQIEVMQKQLLEKLNYAAMQAGLNANKADYTVELLQLVPALIKHNASEDKIKDVLVNALTAVLSDKNFSISSLRIGVVSGFNLDPKENIQDHPVVQKLVDGIASDIISKAKSGDDIGALNDVAVMVVQKKRLGM